MSGNCGQFGKFLKLKGARLCIPTAMKCGYCFAPACMSIMSHAICNPCFDLLMGDSIAGCTCYNCDTDAITVIDGDKYWCAPCWREHGVHPAHTVCSDAECTACAVRDCPHSDPGHYQPAGCPACPR